MISPSKKKSKNKDKHKHHEHHDKEKEKDSKYKTNLYQNETNYSIKLLIIEGKLQIFIKSTKSFSEDIYEFSNTYSFRQLQITNKYFSNFNNIDEICIDLDKLLKLKVIVEEEKDKTLILKIPTSMDKSFGDIIFKLMKVKKVKKVRHSSREKMKNNIDIINKKLYETNIPGKDNTNLLLGNISELVDRVKKLEKKEIEKDKTINKLKEEMNNYQEKLNSSYNYPIYSPLAKRSDIKINLADDKNNNISQIIKNRNEDDDDDDIDINFENDTIKDKKNKKKKKKDIINKSDSDKSEDDSSDSDKKKKKKKKKKKSDSFLDESKKDISNGKEDSDDDKSHNILLKSGNRNFNLNNLNNINNFKPQNETSISGFPIIKRDETLKEYINSRIFYTIREMQTIKQQITQGQKNLHAYFDLLYRASIDGPEESKIDSFCKGKYPQLILFFTQEGARFGVYVEKEKAKSMFKKEDYYKEVPGTSFLFSLNTLKCFPILPKELGTDNRPEKLCFGRTYYYNSNESNWLIYIPNNNFLDVDLKFGDKESSYQNARYSDIVGNSDIYHLKDVEIFQVMIEDDGTGNNMNNNNKKKKKVEKIEKIEEENDEEDKNDKNKIYNDETVISQKKENKNNDQDEDKIKIVEKKKDKDKVEIELAKIGVDDEEDNNV